MFKWLRCECRPKETVARPGCLHLQAYVRDHDRFGTAYCPDCDTLIGVALWLNNLADMVRRAPSL
jgi:hypothetical protein